MNGRNVNWTLTATGTEGDEYTWEQVQAAVLMDIREELRTLNALLSYPNFKAIPQTLTRIRLAIDKQNRALFPKRKVRKGRREAA